MEISQFISGTTWLAILLISIGLVTGTVESNFTTWFFFVFFCFVGLTKWSVERRDRRLRNEKEKK